VHDTYGILLHKWSGSKLPSEPLLIISITYASYIFVLLCRILNPETHTLLQNTSVASYDPLLQCFLREVTEPPVVVVALSSNRCGWHHIFARCYYDQPVAATSDRWTSHEPVATQGHSSDRCSVISSGLITTKGHSSRALRLVLSRS
jgi:hypothetical protein